HRWVPWLVGEGGGDVTIGPAPARMPREPARTRSRCRRPPTRSPRPNTRPRCSSCCSGSKATSHPRPAGRADDDLRKIYADVVKPMLSAEQVPRLCRQPWPLLVRRSSTTRTARAPTSRHSARNRCSAMTDKRGP
ncbi:hypothetical protein ACTMU2_40565, partial [Cupriavidus basilensis]